MDTVIRVTLIANAGVMVTYKNTKMLFDAIQAGNPYFSAPAEETLAQLTESKGMFDGVDFLIYSHYHNDHIDFDLNLRYLSNHVPKHIILPHDEYHRVVSFKDVLDKRGISYIEPGVYLGRKQPLVFENEGVYITAYRTPHDGGHRFHNVSHYTYLLNIGGRNILLGADSPVDECQIYDELAEKEIDLALFNPLFINRKEGRDIINKINPRRMAIYHLPFEGHVNQVFRTFAKSDLKKYEESLPPADMLSEELMSICLSEGENAAQEMPAGIPIHFSTEYCGG